MSDRLGLFCPKRFIWFPSDVKTALQSDRNSYVTLVWHLLNQRWKQDEVSCLISRVTCRG